jgi:predicted alpha/beta-hydrolase family hydrolase
MSALLLTHGAGSNRNAPLLVAISKSLEGVDVVRYDLPFRQKRPSGPPRPGDAAEDRAGLREQIQLLKARGERPLYLGGVSYGGRQASMLVSEEQDLVDGLLLLSYPLHPPGKRDQLRTVHLANIHTKTLFVHGTRDPFGSIEQGAGHDLKGATALIASAFRAFFE